MRKSLDAKLKELTRRGVGSHKKYAQPVTPQMEEELWEKKIFSRESAESVTNIILWLCSKMFGLQAADEHRHLEVGQFTIATNEIGKYLCFTGRSCKNCQGGLHQRKIEPED